MYNVFEVKIAVSQIDGADSNYKDVKCSYKVFCKYEETAKRKAREQMFRDYEWLNNKGFVIEYEVKLLMKNIIKGAF